MSKKIKQLILENEHYTYDEVTKQQFQNHLDGLDELPANQIILSSVAIDYGEDQWTVKAMLLNTTNKMLTLKPANLAILDQNGQAVAKTTEDFKQISQMVTPETAAPFIITITADDFLVPGPYLLGDWQIAFEKPKKRKRQRMDWSGLNVDQLDPEFKKQMEESVAARQFDEGELNFSGLDAIHNANGTLTVSILVSNATDDYLTLRQISLSIYDADEDLAAQGTFPLKPFRLEARTSRPLLLEFPTEGIMKEDMDLSTWRLVIHQNAEK